MKKVLVSFIILCIFAASIFFIGWVQFTVPAGKFGVLLSKTGGIDPDTIIPADFNWRWERLIPTNSELFIFDLAPVSQTIDIEGVLPSGLVYSKMLEGNPDFSWKISLSVLMKIEPAILPKLVEQFNIKDQDALNSWIKNKTASLSDGAIRSIITEAIQNPEDFPDFTSNPSYLEKLVKLKISGTEEQMLEILEVRPTSIVIPDFALYSLATLTYTQYQKEKTIVLGKTANQEAGAAASEFLQIERFERWGELLTKYPILIDFLSVSSENAAIASEALKNLR